MDQKKGDNFVNYASFTAFVGLSNHMKDFQMFISFILLQTRLKRQHKGVMGKLFQDPKHKFCADSDLKQNLVCEEQAFRPNCVLGYGENVKMIQSY